MKPNHKLLFEVPATADRTAKPRRSAAANVVKVNKELAKQRYYWHRRLKGKAVVDGAKRTIDVPYKTFEEIPIGDRYYIGQLINLGYNVQLKIV